MRYHGLELEKEEYHTLVPVLEQQWPGAGVDGWADIFWLDDGVLGLHESAAHRVDCLRIDGYQKLFITGHKYRRGARLSLLLSLLRRKKMDKKYSFEI